MTTTTTRAARQTMTDLVPDADLRTFLRDLRRDGFFVVSSAPVGRTTYQVTYTRDPR